MDANQIIQLQQALDPNEHQAWLNLSTTRKVLGKLNQLRLKKLELAQNHSRSTMTSELELRRFLNDAACIEEITKFLTETPKQ